MQEKNNLLSKEDLIKKKKILAIKKRKENREIELNLVTEKERISIFKELKSNALEIYSRFSFYKDGYKRTFGILLFLILTLVSAASALYYSTFVYKAANIYITVNSVGQLIDPIPLNEEFFTENEIRRFSSEAFFEISNYNYVTVNSSYFSDISGWFTPSSFKKYKDEFNDSSEIKTVKENFFVVNQITIQEATVNKEEGLILREKANSQVYLWVVNIKSRRVYQNRTGFTYEDYNTRMIVTRSPLRINEKGLAVHSIVNEKIDKNK